MPDPAAVIAENVRRVRQRIAEAATRAGRRPDDIQLVAVTKYVGAEEIRAVVRAGCALLGESRPQHLWAMADALRAEPIHWHMIGHLQRNKARRTLPEIAMIESGDSERLITAVDQTAGELGLRMPILIEVNISGDADKGGFAPDEVEAFLARAEEFRHVEIRGLMGMGSLEGGLDTARRDFRRLRELRDRLRVNLGNAVDLAELSMGMSGDYEVAVEEGATIVRVGSALFEGLP